MNGTATRPTAAPSVVEWAPPPELIAGATPSVKRSLPLVRRTQSVARGLSVQAAYAAIDVLFVCLGGISIFLLRFSLVHRLGVTIQLFTSHPARSEERRVGKECRSRWSPYH